MKPYNSTSRKNARSRARARARASRFFHCSSSIALRTIASTTRTARRAFAKSACGSRKPIKSSRQSRCIRDLIPFDFVQVHDGYFSQDKQGHAKDTGGNTADDDDTYNLIMRDKERMLDPKLRYASYFRIPRCAKAGIIPTSSRFARSMKRSRLRKSDRRSGAAFAFR